MNRHRERPAPGKPPLIAGATPLIDAATTSRLGLRPVLPREARRQKGLRPAACPRSACRPDGDIVAHAPHGAEPACVGPATIPRRGRGAATRLDHRLRGRRLNAVLVAEQLFASGCELLINVASAGQITDVAPPPYYILIERALRDEGTSYHYLPPSNYVAAEPVLLALAADALAQAGHQVHVGDSWTTDAPFRETAGSIASCRREGILAVEMEAASLYAFAAARARPVICLAHVSNQLGCVDGDFEKGDGNGASARSSW
jgi:hypothetical protein